MRKHLAPVVVLLIAAVALAADPKPADPPMSRRLKSDAPADVASYWQRCLEAKAEAIKKAEESVAWETQNLEKVKKRGNKTVTDASAARLEKAKARLAMVSDPAHIELAIFGGAKEDHTGATGPITLPDADGPARFDVTKILDGNSAVVEITIPIQAKSQGAGPARMAPVIIRGIDTAKLAPGKPAPAELLPASWHVVELKEIEPGKRPLHVLEPFDLETYLEPVDKK